MSLNSRGGKTPSPVGVERRARQITISNTTVEPDSIKQRSLDEAKHDILDQEALLDFTHPALRTACSISRHQTNSECQTQVALSQSSCLMQGNAGLSKRENIAQDKPKPPPRNIDNTSIPKPKPNIKKQQGFLPSGARGTQTSLSESEGIRFAKVVPRESAFDVLATQSSLNLHRKRTEDYPQRRTYASNEQYELKYSDRNATTSKISFSTEPLPNQSPTIEKRRRLFDLSKDTKVDATFLSNLRRPKKENNIQTATGNVSKLSPQTTRASHQKHRFWWKDPLPVNQSVCVSKDYSCQSRDIDRGTDSHSLNQFKTCLVAPQTQKASGPASIECATSKTILSTPDTISNKHKEMYCPFNTNSVGIRSKGVFDLPLQHTAYQRPDQATTTTAFSSHTPDYPPAGRAFIMEETEDPYYVTMYYPGSVYVDMSDVVPPEVRPKPAVPAKPPNVGAPSPSSPFPPQGPGIGGGGGVSGLPPSAIPVPIVNHGHSVGHNIGHGVGHVAGHVGGHTAAHNGGQGHGGSHSSGGGSTLLGYIGIDTIIEQMRKKTMKTGFDFNIMVVGHSGLGKSTLVNTLFKSQVSRRSAGWARDEKIPKTVEIKAVSHVLEEGGVKMKLTVVDTPGFGDQINNDNCWEPISKYINEQYEKFLKEEVNITRKKRIPDTRVHCCLFFITPTGRSLRPLDLEFMKRLSHSVNIIPVIAKSDSMTIEERQEFKQRVRKELEMAGIEFYPQKEFDEDMEDKSDNDKIREAMPFAVVGSDKEYPVNNKRVLGRKTAWGIVEVENPNHCEFAQLRDFLIRSHLQDLKEVTHNIHYETYRAKRLNANGGLHPISSNDTQESNL
ncbi:Neuronal-specific septin-3 [Dissostichus eleginoides]|uniref:Neuronal-specific septin-3 n=1 Tax=Dissostichus eleginoides TaxID=100907 RepID=A0AAD9BP25_DISEL|nr:Neuronal-specific septin-3 [Dissostichus eleginoides]